jgi:hypothetical protein
MMQSATALQLPFWQAPQEPLAIAIAKGTCRVFFALWDYDGNVIPNCLGKATFSKVFSTRTLSTDLLPYQLNPHHFQSYLLEVENSGWLAAESQTRLDTYSTWRSWDQTTYHHYVLEGAESYLEVLAAGFTAEMATADEYQQHAFLLS